MEANANRHKMVWRKNTERYKKKVDEQLDDLWEEIDRLNDEEDNLYGDKDYPEVGEDVSQEKKGKKIDEAVKEINKKISTQERKKKTIEKKIEKLEERKEKYIHQEEVLQERNSYAKTDPDATAMQMKNEVIAPGYNVMIGTENQFIVDYTIEQNASDGSCFKHIMDDIQKLYGKFPLNIVGDCAFGNEENYEYCDKNDLKAYLKYSTFHQEKTKKFKKDKFRKENFLYDKVHDWYICPAGKTVHRVNESEYVTKTGYKQRIKTYMCYDCESCIYRPLCCKGKGNRTVTRSEKLEKYKQKARKMLDSPEGEKLLKRRGWDVETVFGDFKQNRKFRRFLLRGLKKVEIETGLHAIAYNIRKIGKLILEQNETHNKVNPNLNVIPIT